MIRSMGVTPSTTVGELNGAPVDETRVSVLLVSTCADALHELEFVRPVAAIVEAEGLRPVVRHCSRVTAAVLRKHAGVIICGTALQDDAFLDADWSWLRSCPVPLLGICAGMQVLCRAFGGALRERTEIGFFTEHFTGFLGLDGPAEVFHLHHSVVSVPEGFRTCSSGVVAQAVVHSSRPFFGALFHPEVRQEGCLAAFCAVVKEQARVGSLGGEEDPSRHD